MVAVVIFALQPDFWLTLAIVVVLAAAMFSPLKFIHPVRTMRWRQLSLPVALAWTAFAGWSAWADFDPGAFVHAGLAADQPLPGLRRHRPADRARARLSADERG